MNQEEMRINAEDLFNNPTTRVPICLTLDLSTSMQGEKINELNQGVDSFFKSLRSDELTLYSAEVGVVTFASTVNVALDFAFIDKQRTPTFRAEGWTVMGAGVDKALDLLEERKKWYSQAGVDYWQPWLVLMTDGQATDDIENAVQRTQQLLKQKKLSIIPLGVGNDADLQTLARFSPDRTPVRLKSVAHFKEFFQWLSKSVEKASQSMPGEQVKINKDDINFWADMKQGAKGWDSL